MFTPQKKSKPSASRIARLRERYTNRFMDFIGVQPHVVTVSREKAIEELSWAYNHPERLNNLRLEQALNRVAARLTKPSRPLVYFHVEGNPKPDFPVPEIPDGELRACREEYACQMKYLDRLRSA